MNTDKYLYVSSVGSQLWHMERADSDIDYFAIYQAPSTDILLGKNCMESKHVMEGTDDIQQHEIGRVVDSLLLGNFNFLLGVFSTLGVKHWSQLDELRRLGRANLSRRCYKSIHGLAVGNFNKYIESGKEAGAKAQKRLNTICRTMAMGIHLLNTGEFKFAPFTDGSREAVISLLKELEAAHLNSTLPEKPICPERLEDWLLARRMEDLKVRGI